MAYSEPVIYLPTEGKIINSGHVSFRELAEDALEVQIMPDEQQWSEDFDDSHCGFSPVQHDVKLLGQKGAPSLVPGKHKVRFDNTIFTCNNNNNKNSNTVINILSKKSIIGDGEYSIEDFNYLIGKDHVDPENGLLYVTDRIRMHGRFIAVDRRLAASPKGKLEAIHAVDVVAFH